MKISLRLIILVGLVTLMHGGVYGSAHILMLEVLEQFQFPIGSLCKYRSTEWLHDLLDRNRLSCELILCRAVLPVSPFIPGAHRVTTYHTRPKAPMPTG